MVIVLFSALSLNGLFMVTVFATTGTIFSNTFGRFRSKFKLYRYFSLRSIFGSSRTSVIRSRSSWSLSVSIGSASTLLTSSSEAMSSWSSISCIVYTYFVYNFSTYTIVIWARSAMRIFQVVKFCMMIARYITWKVTKFQFNNLCSFLNLLKIILPWQKIDMTVFPGLIEVPARLKVKIQLDLGLVTLYLV